MNICQRLFESLAGRAETVSVDILCVGLGYTAVTTTAGNAGIAYTPFEGKTSCSPLNRLPECEGRPASVLLELLLSSEPLYRCIGLATANALIAPQTGQLPEDRDNAALFSILGITAGTKVAMVGAFGPLIPKIRELGAELEVIDTAQGIGEHTRFTACLQDWAQAVIMTSTALQNGTADTMLNSLGPGVRTALLGPSTPLTAAPFTGLSVHVLAGTVPVDTEATLRAVRHGQGTPVLQRYARKPYLRLKTGD